METADAFIFDLNGTMIDDICAGRFTREDVEASGRGCG